ncbi:MAG: EthD family reductase [Deltaproteobacteria bacterium]|nr:EthD family reductase [Deltaproteobacteria bacterium]
MVKLIICATRRSDISRHEFDSYWREKHGPLVKSVPEFARYVRKYVQCHLLEGTAPSASRATMTVSRSRGSIAL